MQCLSLESLHKYLFLEHIASLRNANFIITSLTSTHTLGWVNLYGRKQWESWKLEWVGITNLAMQLPNILKNCYQDVPASARPKSAKGWMVKKKMECGASMFTCTSLSWVSDTCQHFMQKYEKIIENMKRLSLDLLKLSWLNMSFSLSCT